VQFTVDQDRRRLEAIRLEPGRFVEPPRRGVRRVHAQRHLAHAGNRCRELQRLLDQAPADSAAAMRGCDIHAPDDPFMCELAATIETDSDLADQRIAFECTEYRASGSGRDSLRDDFERSVAFLLEAGRKRRRRFPQSLQAQFLKS
jgi:hypothetical protein